MEKVKQLKQRDIFAEVEKEVSDEILDGAKSKLKFKIHERAKALQVLKNIERELEELELEIRHELGE